jgi:hypothetical protein
VRPTGAAWSTDAALSAGSPPCAAGAALSAGSPPSPSATGPSRAARPAGSSRRAASGVRLVLALLALAGAAALLAYAGPSDWPRGLTDLPRWLAAPPAEARVLAFATVAAYGCLAWLAFALLAVAAGAGHRVPGSFRRLAERVLGVALVTAATGVLAAGPAAADPGRGAGPFDRPAVTLVTPSRHPAAPRATPYPAPSHPAARTGVPVAPPLDRPAAPPAAPLVATTDPFVPVPGPAPRPVPDGAVVVHRGDTLWDIAARHLGPGATPAAIAAEWPRWYAANRAVIGPDPDRILPGQRLAAPGSAR